MDKNLNKELKQQIRVLEELGVSHAAMEKFSGVNKTTIAAWLKKEDAQMRGSNREKIITYLRKFRGTVGKRVGKFPPPQSTSSC